MSVEKDLISNIEKSPGRLITTDYIELGNMLYSILYNFVYNYESNLEEYVHGDYVRAGILDSKGKVHYPTNIDFLRGSGTNERELYTELIIKTEEESVPLHSVVMCRCTIKKGNSKSFAKEDDSENAYKLYIMGSPDMGDRGMDRNGRKYYFEDSNANYYLLALYFNLYKVEINGNTEIKIANQFVDKCSLQYVTMAAARNVFAAMIKQSSSHM